MAAKRTAPKKTTPSLVAAPAVASAKQQAAREELIDALDRWPGRLTRQVGSTWTRHLATIATLSTGKGADGWTSEQRDAVAGALRAIEVLVRDAEEAASSSARTDAARQAAANRLARLHGARNSDHADRLAVLAFVEAESRVSGGAPASHVARQHGEMQGRCAVFERFTDEMLAEMAAAWRRGPKDRGGETKWVTLARVLREAGLPKVAASTIEQDWAAFTRERSG